MNDDDDDDDEANCSEFWRLSQHAVCSPAYFGHC